MDGVFKENMSQFQNLTEEYINKLMLVWKRIFDENDCKANLEQLAMHLRNIYEELISESKGKEQSIINEIINLKNETENLQSLLKTDLPTKTAADAPLLVIKSELSNGLVELREKLHQREQQICEMLVEQEKLCEELGESPHVLTLEPFPTVEEVEEVRQYLNQLEVERKERLNKVSLLRREIEELLNQLGIEVPKDLYELIYSTKNKLTKKYLMRLTTMRDCYARQIQDIREGIDAMKRKLEKLWDCLETSPNTRRNFSHYTKYNQNTFDAYYSELNRCEKLKMQNIKNIVNAIRRDIIKWWDKTLESEEERGLFTHFYSDCYTQDLLELHELKLKDLEHYYEKNKEIFELYDNRKMLWERMTALELKALDPSRYNNRGGQLLKEERERKLIATKLPKIERRIKELVEKYEKREQQPFRVFGKNILNVMAAEWENKRQTKAQISTVRKNTKATSMPAHSTPTLRRNTSTSAMRRTPLQTNNHAFASKTHTDIKKRKLSPAEIMKPLPKRSLLYSVNNPSVNVPKRTPSRSPHKATRVLGTINRRRSVRQSNNVTGKKKRSIHKVTKLLPEIMITDASSDQLDSTYSGFKKSISSTARSSIIPNSNVSASTSRGSKRIRLTSTEDIRALTAQTPSPKNSAPCMTGSGLTGSGRKFTKNLPIII